MVLLELLTIVLFHLEELKVQVVLRLNIIVEIMEVQALNIKVEMEILLGMVQVEVEVVTMVVQVVDAMGGRAMEMAAAAVHLM